MASNYPGPNENQENVSFCFIYISYYRKIRVYEAFSYNYFKFMPILFNLR